MQDEVRQAWSRGGNYKTAVEVESAVLELPDTLGVKIPLNADHSNMVKFSSKQDLGYTSALQYLREFERNAPAAVAARFGM